VHDLAVLATMALLFVAVAQVMLLARHRRKLEERLSRAHAAMDVLHNQLADATRPPVQFARMRLRERAVYRFGRLGRAAPRRSRAPASIEGIRDLTH
jgi:hypothetical protein